MKSKILKTVCLMSITFVYGCRGLTNETAKVITSLTYKDLLGTYLFIPDSMQAHKLGIQLPDTVILKITDDSLRRFPKDSVAVYGKYYINKMILVINSNPAKPYSDSWIFFHIKDKSSRKSEYINNISFEQNVIEGNNISFDIKRDENGVLHLTGNTRDPKYEVIQVVDFKKVK